MPMYPKNMSIIDLVSNPTAHVTGAAGVRLRNNAGVLQISENAGAYHRPDGPNMFHVQDYGASTALADNSAAFQAAINAAGAVGGTVVIPAGVWKILAELTVAARVTIIGAGIYITSIRADADMRSIIYLNASCAEFNQFELDGNGHATNAAYFFQSNFSRATNVRFTRATGDGVRLATAGANDNDHFIDCWFVANGTMYQTGGIGNIDQNFGRVIETPGTVSTVVGNATVIGDKTTFTTMGLRNGDILRVGVGTTLEFLMIKEVVDNTTLTLADISLPTLARSAQPFAIGVGDGYHEDSSNENNINHITGGLFRGNSGAQMFFNGLYGPKVDHVQIDYIPSYGVIVSDGSLKTVYTSSFDHLYFESMLGGGFFLSSAGGITLSNIFNAGVGSAYNGVVTSGVPPRFRITNDSRVSGAWIGGGSPPDDNAVEAIGGGLCSMPVTQSANQRNFSVVGPLVLIQDTAAAVIAGTTIVPTRTHRRFDLTGNVTMTAIPHISIPGAGTGVGQVVVLTNASSYTLTLQDAGTLTGSGLILGKPTRSILPGKSMILILQGDNQWHHLLTTEEGVETLASGIVSHQFWFGTPATDNSGTAGATTINKCNGRAAIATGASTVTVTNSSVAAVDTVVVTALGRDATCTNLVVDSVSDGSFIVSGAANATADTKFMFAVIKAT